MAPPTEDLAGKVCLVTGATSGIGLATATGLARRRATVVLVSRNERKCRRVADEIRSQTGASVEFLVADLSSQRQVRSVAAEYQRRYSQLDVLVNNAGSNFMRRRETEDGLEMTFALNHLAYFLLTNLLLESVSVAPSGRIVNVASSAHESAKIDFQNLQGEREYDRLTAYSQSKLANLLFTFELARRLGDRTVCVNALNPGLVASNLGIDNGWLRVKARNLLRRRSLISPAEGARTSIFLASSPLVEGVSGRYFFDCQEVPSSPASRDVRTAARLWALSEELTDCRTL